MYMYVLHSRSDETKWQHIAGHAFRTAEITDEVSNIIIIMRYMYNIIIIITLRFYVSVCLSVRPSEAEMGVFFL